MLLLWGAAPGIARAQASAEKLAESSRNQNFLGWMIDASGPIGWVILGLSFYLVALVVWMFLRYRKPVAIPPALLKETQDLLTARAYTDAYQRLAASESFFARVLSAGVRKLPSGLSSARDAMALANEDASMEMEHRTTYLATVGTLGPMIGLVGTVYGMILAFRVIAVAGSSPDAADLAAGISTALFATLEGIAISIPAIYFYAFFRNRISRLSLDVEMACDGLLEQFAQGLRTPHPLATAAAPPGPARKGLPEPE